MGTIAVTDNNFKAEVLDSELPVLVDFWAEWCGPCRVIAPILEKIAEEFSGRVKVAKCNVDHNRDTPMRYGIRSIPTLLFFQDGEVRDQMIGAAGKPQLVRKLNEFMEKFAPAW